MIDHSRGSWSMIREITFHRRLIDWLINRYRLMSYRSVDWLIDRSLSHTIDNRSDRSNQNWSVDQKHPDQTKPKKSQPYLRIFRRFLKSDSNQRISKRQRIHQPLFDHSDTEKSILKLQKRQNSKIHKNAYFWAARHGIRKVAPGKTTPSVIRIKGRFSGTITRLEFDIFYNIFIWKQRWETDLESSQVRFRWSPHCSRQFACLGQLGAIQTVNVTKAVEIAPRMSQVLYFLKVFPRVIRNTTRALKMAAWRFAQFGTISLRRAWI